MTLLIVALGLGWLALLAASRERRQRRHALARERRRATREQQWRAMIRDADDP